jgi:hypothetical protein
MKRAVSLLLALIILVACCGCAPYETSRDRPYDRDRHHDGNINPEIDVDRNQSQERDHRI